MKIVDFRVAGLEASNLNDMTGNSGTLRYVAPEVHTPFELVLITIRANYLK